MSFSLMAVHSSHPSEPSLLNSPVLKLPTQVYSHFCGAPDLSSWAAEGRPEEATNHVIRASTRTNPTAPSLRMTAPSPDPRPTTDQAAGRRTFPRGGGLSSAPDLTPRHPGGQRKAPDAARTGRTHPLRPKGRSSVGSWPLSTPPSCTSTRVERSAAAAIVTAFVPGPPSSPSSSH